MMTQHLKKIESGEIWEVRLSISSTDTVGHEQSKNRPCIVIVNNPHISMTTIISLTSKLKTKYYPDTCLIKRGRGDFLDYQDHIFLVPYLHSKIYCNESSVLVTSLNLSISSLFNQNYESGVVLTRKNSIESQEYKKIISYIESLKYRAN